MKVGAMCQNAEGGGGRNSDTLNPARWLVTNLSVASGIEFAVGRRMKNGWALVALIGISSGLATKEVGAEPLSLNCLIREWRLSRPIDKQAGAPHESLDTPLIEEAAFTPEGDWETLTQDWEARTVFACDFGYLNSDRVVYGVAVVECEAAGEAVLAIGADDGFRAYWNGAEVLASNSVNCVFLDDHLAKVTLRQGRNVLLMKLENWAGPAGYCARLTPHQEVSRRLAVATADDQIPIADVVEVPDLVFELLDEAGRTLAQYPCSGNRYRWAAWQRVSRRAAWLLYLPEAMPTFARLRLRLAGETARVVAELPSTAFDLPLAYLKKEDWRRDPVKTVDITMHGPISGAVFFSAESGDRVPAEEVAPGTYRLPEPAVFAVEYAFMAPGRTQGTVLLRPGKRARVINRGQIAAAVLLVQAVDEAGRPLAAAVAHLLVKGKKHHTAISDAEGRLPFRLSRSEASWLAGADEVMIEVSAAGHAPVRLNPAAFEPTEQELEAGLRQPDGEGLLLPTTQLKATLAAGKALDVTFIHAFTGEVIQWEDAWVINQAQGGAASVTQHRDQNGIARLTQGHGPGSRLLLVAEGFTPQAVETDAALWERGHFKALMQPAEPLHGVVLDAQNRPLRGAVGWFPKFEGEDLPGGWERTGMDGRFTIRTHTGSPAEIAIYAKRGPTFEVRMEKTSEDQPMVIRVE
jgi:hypothetical protein